MKRSRGLLDRFAHEVDRRPLPSVPLRLVGATGFIGALCVLIGVAQDGSPFTLQEPGAWYFGVLSTGGAGGQSGDSRFLAIMLVYFGILLMLGSWFEIVRTLRRHPNTPLRRVMTVFVAWAIPILCMPPLFSRDVYTYAAQGQIVAKGLNPYQWGPNVLGPNPFARLVDPLWVNVPAPYGPLWERMSEWVVVLAGHHVLTSLIGFRVVALVGIGLTVWGVVSLARSLGRDQSTAFAIAVLNPLVLLVLLGGEHNEAMMIGLLVAGCALARRNHVLVGLVLCALAAEVKVPALIGAVFIGIWWNGPAAARRQRLIRIVGAVLLATGFMAVTTTLCGLGWHWASVFPNPGKVVSWVDPTTAAGLTLLSRCRSVGLRRAHRRVRAGDPRRGCGTGGSHLGRPDGARRADWRHGSPRMVPSRFRTSRTGGLAVVRDVGSCLPCCGGGGMDPSYCAGTLSARVLRGYSCPRAVWNGQPTRSHLLGHPPRSSRRVRHPTTAPVPC